MPNEKPHYTTRKPYWLVAFFGVFAIAMIVALFFLIQDALGSAYVELFTIVMSFFSLSFLIVCVFALFQITFFEFYKGFLVERAILGNKTKKWAYSDFTGWMEMSGYDEYKDANRLLIQGNKGRLVIDSLIMTDYNNFREILTKLVPEDLELKRSYMLRMNLRGIRFLVVLSILVGYGFFYVTTCVQSEIKQDELKTVIGTLATQPKITYDSDNNPELKLTLNEVPGLYFYVNDVIFDGFASEQFLQMVKENDSVFIEIEEIDFDKWISKSIPLTYFERLDSKGLEMVTLENKEFGFLTLDAYNKESGTNLRIGRFMVGLFFLFFFFQIFYQQHRRTKMKVMADDELRLYPKKLK